MDVVLTKPGAIDSMMSGSGTEVPDIRFAVTGNEAIAD
jgi:hypothetical protein